MDYYTMVDYHITVDYYTMVDCYITVDYYTTVDYYITVDYYTSPSVRQPVSWLVTSKPYSAQLSSTDALGCQLEQHTQITLKAHFKCDRHAKVGRWRWGWHYVFFSPNIHVMLIRPVIFIKSPPYCLRKNVLY